MNNGARYFRQKHEASEIHNNINNENNAGVSKG